MSRELPLWNEDETDILPKFQLSFGHIVCDAQLNQTLVSYLCDELELGKLTYFGEFKPETLPAHVSNGFRTLGTVDCAHVLIVNFVHHCVVFGPHMFFFNNTAWISWNKRVGGLMAIVGRQDVSDCTYLVFRSGKRLLSASVKEKNIQILEDPNVEVYFQRDILYRTSDEEVEATQDIVSLLRTDVEISQENGEIHIRERFSDKAVLPDHLKHFVFRRE